jgi:diguanylate cyclase (GGDEF)-like protein/PAS domain S-box-containing protein
VLHDELKEHEMIAISRRQAVLVFFIVQLLVFIALFIHSIRVYPDIRQPWMENTLLFCIIVFGGLYWRGWEPARYLNAGLLVILTLLGVDASYGPTSVAFISLAVPALILVLADYRWVIGSATLLMAAFQLMFAGNSEFQGMINLTLFIAAIVAMAINSLIADSARRAAEASARHSQQALADLKEQSHALRQSEERFRLIAEHVDEVFWLETGDGKTVLYVNPTYERLYGQSCEALYANPQAYLAVVHPDDYEKLARYREQMQSECKAYEIIFRVQLADQTIHWIRLQHRPVRNYRGEVLYHVGIAADITRQKLYEKQIEYLAYTDNLTGLANRNRLYDQGSRYLEHTRSNGQPLIMLYLDLDRFKRINDTLGHDAGDIVLAWVATRLRSCVPDTSRLYRLGGDEFAVLLTDTSLQQSLQLARSIHREIQQPCNVHDETVHLDSSIGIAASDISDTSINALLMRADIAMYEAKTSGSGVQWYDPCLHPMLLDRLQLENELRHALQNDELTLFYQPIVNLRDNQVVMVEALVRWQHPQRGLLSPAAFLPLAEEARLQDKLDYWVCVNALSQVAHWAASGWNGAVTINLTAQSLQMPTIVEDIAAFIMAEQAPPHQIVIELTEHTAIQNLSVTQQVLERLRNLGIRIALDDFGSGYASLNYLRVLPVDVLKLDKAFARGIGYDPRDEAVVQALLTLGYGLELEIIVEGVEHAAQLDWLQSQGVKLVQGYLLGRPAPPHMLEASLLQWTL